MKRFFPTLVLLAVLPSALLAQGMGGMGGMGGGRRGGGMGGGPPGPRNQMPKFATAKELETFNAADALLKESRKLKLTEDQVTQLTTLRATLYEQNADVLVRYDAVRRDFKIPKALEQAGQGGGGEPPSPEEMSRLREQMLAMVTVHEELMTRRPANVAACLALVDDTQKERATKLLEDQTNDLKKAVPERPRSGRR